MNRIWWLVLIAIPVAAVVLLAADSPSNSPQFTKDNQLLRPANYRDWVFLSSGLGMNYGAPTAVGLPRVPEQRKVA